MLGSFINGHRIEFYLRKNFLLLANSNVLQNIISFVVLLFLLLLLLTQKLKEMDVQVHRQTAWRYHKPTLEKHAESTFYYTDSQIKSIVDKHLVSSLSNLSLKNFVTVLFMSFLMLQMC
jgi:hypothetical protein